MAEVNAIILHADGNAEIKYIEGSAETYHDLVGGWIQGIKPQVDHGFGDWFAYCNEEGKLERLPRNVIADEILTNLGWAGVLGGDFLVGTIVIVGALPSGDDTDVPDKTLQYVLAFYREHGGIQTEEDA